jgi:DNA-binding protein HU-beta
MNKSELVEAIAKATNFTKADSERALNAIIETITKNLKRGKIVQLIGFGTFCVRKRKARKGRNPRTGEEIKIKAAKVPAFSPGKALKEALR